MSSSALKLSVVVVGAGIGGLTVAICLGQQGHHVHVLERQEQPVLNGGGILLSPSATRIMAGLGVLEGLRKVGEECPAQALRRYKNSELIHRRLPESLSTFP
jgi:salicylate hydroxylase